MMIDITCIWCGVRVDEWDPSMYRFCDGCLDKLTALEVSLTKKYGRFINVLEAADPDMDTITRARLDNR